MIRIVVLATLYTHREFSIRQLADLVLERTLERGDPDLAVRMIDTYLGERSTGVRYLDGLGGMLARLRDRYTVGIITNTHHPELVPDQLRAMGTGEFFVTVVTSIDFGTRKPNPSIFEHTLAVVGSEAHQYPEFPPGAG